LSVPSRPLEHPVVAMSAPTPSWHPMNPQARPPTGALDLPTLRLTPLRPDLRGAGRRMVLPARSPAGTAVDVLARLGSAVTVAALLVLTGTVVGATHAGPTPAGVTTPGR
jgi:hypothetical protein